MPDSRRYRDRAQYLIKAVVRRRQLVRDSAIRYLGGKCKQCGYRKCKAALEFHHISSQKEFGISQKGYTRSWKRVQAELDKCVLLCANCHREIHCSFKKQSPPR